MRVDYPAMPSGLRAASRGSLTRLAGLFLSRNERAFMKISFYHDRKGTHNDICHTENWQNHTALVYQAPQCNTGKPIKSIRIGDSHILAENPIVWTQPAEKVRVHPELHRQAFHSTLGTDGESWDVYVEVDKHGGVWREPQSNLPVVHLYKATYEEA